MVFRKVMEFVFADRFESNLITRGEQKRFGSGENKQRNRCPSDDAPASRAGLRINAGLAAGDAHRTGGDLLSWRLESRGGDTIRHCAQIGEAGAKAQHIDAVDYGGMELADFSRSESGLSGHVD